MIDQRGLLRIGLAAVYLWFGISQLLSPESFLAYAPSWLGMPATVVFLNGIFETVFGTLLLLGLFTQVTASVLAVHMVGIIAGLGYNEIAIRDVGLTIALVVIALNGTDDYSVMRVWNTG